MATTNGHFDAQARVLQLDERVSNIRSGLVNLEAEMRNSFVSINANLSNLSNEIRGASKTQWPVIIGIMSVGYAVLAGVGGILYWPLVSDIAAIEERAVTRTEWEDNLSRGTENRKRLEEAIAERIPRAELNLMAAESRADRTRLGETITRVEEHKVDRNEWMERNRARDTELADISRRIEELSRNSAATYNLRDVIVDLKNQVDKLQGQVLSDGM
jgi:hypothetical protein